MRSKSHGARVTPLVVSAMYSHRVRGDDLVVPFLDHPGTAICVCLDRARRVLLVQQYRPIVGERLLEIPGGVLAQGESPHVAVRREVQEETGIRLGRIESLGSFFLSVGVTNERVHIFLARNIDAAVRPEPRSRLRWIALEKLSAMICKAGMSDAKSALAVALTRSRLLK